MPPSGRLITHHEEVLVSPKQVPPFETSPLGTFLIALDTTDAASVINARRELEGNASLALADALHYYQKR